MNKRTFKDLLRRGALGGGASLPKGTIGAWLVRNGLTDSIGISIADKSNVRAELWALLFDGSDVAYSDAQRIINIEASIYLNCGYELVGNAAKGYALYVTGTDMQRAYRCFNEVFVETLAYQEDGTLWMQEDGTPVHQEGV